MTSREQLEKELANIENKLYEMAILDNKDEQYELESLLEEQSYVQAYQSSYSFLAHSWQTFNGEVFLPAKHLHAIAEHLDATLTGEIKRLIINVPPRTAKSALVTKAFPAYCWIKQPHLKFANVSYGYGLAEEGSVHSRQIMQSDWYKRGMATVWRDMGATPWEFRRDKNMKNDYENNANGRRFATSCPEGIFTGIGADTIIIDDPVKANAAYSKNTLDKVNQWVSNTLMSRLNNQSEGVIILVMQRISECLLPGNLITTPTGVRKIEELNVNDSIISSIGFDNVLHKTNKQYSGTVYGIRTYGDCNTIWVTDTHELLTGRGWIKAEDLLETDIIINNINYDVTEDLDYIISLYPDLEPGKQVHKPSGNYKNATPPISKEELSEQLNANTILKVAEHYNVHRSTIHNYMYHYGLRKQRRNYLPKEILENKLFWRFIGYWLAEGNITKSRNKNTGIQLVFHKNEIEYINNIVELISPYLRITVTPHKEDNYTKLQFNSTQLANFLADNFGLLSHYKHLPSWINKLPIEFKQELIKGYYRGDGSLSKNMCRFGSVSIDLLTGMRHLLYQLNVKSQLYKNNAPTKPRFIKGKQIYPGISYELRCLLRDAHWLEDYDKTLSIAVETRKEKNTLTKIKIKSIETKQYDGLVYDITTNAGNFISGLTTVHNCDMTGFFLQQEGVWEHLCLPMEYEDTQRYWTRIGWTDWRTNQNELLEPVRFPRDVVERLKKDEEWSYASQYQQQPVPLGGGLIRREWWQNWYILPTQFDATCMAFDLSMNDKETSDNTSLIVMGRKDNKFYIIDLVYGKMDILKQVESIIELCNKYPMIRTRLIEQRANGDAVIALLKRTITGLIPLITKGDKEQRILSCVPEINAGNVLVPDENVHSWIKPLLLEATMFPRGKNDDAIDSMQMALNHLVTSNVITYMPLQVITDSPGNTTRAEIREHIMDSSYGVTVNVTRNYIKGLFE